MLLMALDVADEKCVSPHNAQSLMIIQYDEKSANANCTCISNFCCPCRSPAAAVAAADFHNHSLLSWSIQLLMSHDWTPPATCRAAAVATAPADATAVAIVCSGQLSLPCLWRCSPASAVHHNGIDIRRGLDVADAAGWLGRPVH